MELNSITWGMDHSIVIRMLQTILKNPNPNIAETTPKSTQEIVSQLITPQKSGTRKFLGKLIPLCQKLVQRREKTKSLLVAYHLELKMGFRYLSELMVHEGLLPNKSLIFYLTLEELKNVIKHRDNQLINKAMRRQKLFKKWNEHDFPEFIFGVPKLVLPNDENGHQYGQILKGSPVSMGTVVGRAYVVKNFNEVDSIESGDILITNSFDIGWSGFFPIVGGIVTELGGLISHGAVVAREYGIPCIVGVQGVTNILKTGDKVKLVADSGLIFKIE